ncbi:MAG: DUF4857 domain-containing protein [Bacteroidales bacterium]|nr:DUF4857 domain-containing protein [Bacteroidales bacterium]
MKKTAQIYLYILIAIICLWHLPSFYNFLTAESETRPFILYSSVSKDFIIRKNEDNKTHCFNSKFEPCTREVYDSILPEYSAKQLAADNRLQDTILGRNVSLKLFTDENLTYRIKPEEVFGPYIHLYQLMESQSGRVELEMPPDVFRITDSGLEFISKKDNTTDKEKSEKFTNALKKADFKFPALEVAANPSERKKYDNGFLLTDAVGKFFHFKMVKGEPYVKQIELPVGVIPVHTFVTEFAGRHHLGFFFDAKGYSYVIELPENKIIKTGLPPVDLENEEFFVMGNIFSWTVRISGQKETTWYALDAKSYKLLDKFTLESKLKPLKGLSFKRNGWVELGWR